MNSTQASRLIAICKKELKSVLKRFGECSFDDRGPHEVMDLSALSELFRQLDPEKAGEVIRALDSMGGREMVLANAIAIDLQEWDALWDTVSMKDYEL